MAKKKPQPPKKGPKKGVSRPKSRAKKDATPTALPDPREMQKVLRELLGGLANQPATASSQAEELLDRADDATNEEERIRLATKAIELDPNLADAHLLLAEMAPTRKRALELYEEALAAGERAIGPEAFRDDAGHFWGLIETRPYMRAREGLAHLLWTLGRRDEAAGHLREMLRLNPNDNQGVRYTLMAWLVNLGRDDELAILLDRYDEPSAAWTYSKALLAFRQLGDTPESRKRLAAAKKANKHVPAFLTGDEPMPPTMPDSYGWGDRSEAILYAADSLGAWKSTPGAVSWVREALRPRKKKATKAKATAGPSAFDKGRLRRLPKRFDVWQVDARALASVVESDHGDMIQPWMALVISRSDGVVLAQDMALESPSPALMWDLISRAMREPLVEEPHRPSQVQARPGPMWDELGPHLEAIDVECVEAEELDQVDFLLGELAAHLTAEEPPGLLDMPGMTAERVAGFYRAAAEFYRQAPWARLGYEYAIRVQCDRFDSGPWFAVVMGQSGLTLGVALYEDLALLRRMWAGDLSDEESARQTVALTVTFDPDRDLPTADLLAAREHGWDVAGPEAYPTVFRKEPGLSMRPPLAWELELLEACLRAIPDFVAHHPPGDPLTSRMTVPTASGTLDLALSWVEEA